MLEIFSKLIKSGEISINTEFRDSLTQNYLFSWDDIPGNNSEILRKFLTQTFRIEWAKTAKIEKIDDGKTIKLTNDNNFLSLRLNNEKTNVNLNFDDSISENFITRTVNGKLNIYSNYGFRTIIKLDADIISFIPDPELFKRNGELPDYIIKYQEHNKKVQDILNKLYMADTIKWLRRGISGAVLIICAYFDVLNIKNEIFIILSWIVLIIIITNIQSILGRIFLEYVRFRIHDILS